MEQQKDFSKYRRTALSRCSSYQVCPAVITGNGELGEKIMISFQYRKMPVAPPNHVGSNPAEEFRIHKGLYENNNRPKKSLVVSFIP